MAETEKVAFFFRSNSNSNVFFSKFRPSKAKEGFGLWKELGTVGSETGPGGWSYNGPTVRRAVVF